MAVDYSILTRVPTIGSRIMAGMEAGREATIRNQLLQQQREDRAMQIEDRRRQMQQAQQQEAVFGQAADIIRKAGLDPDDPATLQQFTAAAVQSRNPQLISLAGQMTERSQKRRQAADERARVAAIMGGQQQGVTPAAPAMAAAPTPAAPPASMGQPQMNTLAPAAATVNAMTTPAADPRLAALQMEIDTKERQRTRLLADGSPEALKLAAALQADLSRLDREYQRSQPKAETSQIQNYRLWKQEGNKGGFADYLRAASPKTEVTVKGSETVLAELARDLVKERRTIANAQDTIDNLNKAKELVPSAKAFLGPGGEPLLNVASFLNSRLNFDINVKGVTDATELRTRLFQQILDNLKKLDSQPTQQQQAVMQQALGSLGTDPNALPRILDKIEDSIRGRVDVYNQDVESLTAEGVKFLRPVKLSPRKTTGDTGAAPPPAAIEYLRANPSTKAFFDAKYGAGAADRALKGQ